MLFAAEVFLVLGFSQPSPLARLLARRATLGLGTIFLPAAHARVAAKQLLATQASTSSGFDHGASGPMGDRNHAHKSAVCRGRETLRGDSHRRFHDHRCRHGIVNGNTADSQKRSRSQWNRVHVPLEFAFTMRWKPRTPCAGICSAQVSIALPVNSGRCPIESTPACLVASRCHQGS